MPSRGGLPNACVSRRPSLCESTRGIDWVQQDMGEEANCILAIAFFYSRVGARHVVTACQNAMYARWWTSWAAAWLPDMLTGDSMNGCTGPARLARAADESLLLLRQGPLACHG